MVASYTKIIIKKGDTGPAVEDLQNRLCSVGYLKESEIDSYYGDVTAASVKKFSEDKGLQPTENVTEKVWALLVDASYKLGDRNLFLRMPYFHGNDVKELQQALGSLGFQILHYDGIFGPSTERAVRRFQINMGLPTDGIVSSLTFTTLRNLKFTWSDKSPLENEEDKDLNVFWRANKVLEKYSICIFGTDEFTRDVAGRISNLARATNPFSKVLASSALSVAPDKDTLLLHLVLPEEEARYSEDNNIPKVMYAEDENNEIIDTKKNAERFIKRLINALIQSGKMRPPRMTIEIPGTNWNSAGEDRSAQHFAITILDALCSALDKLEQEENKD